MRTATASKPMPTPMPASAPVDKPEGGGELGLLVCWVDDVMPCAEEVVMSCGDGVVVTAPEEKEMFRLRSLLCQRSCTAFAEKSQLVATEVEIDAVPVAAVAVSVAVCVCGSVM